MSQRLNTGWIRLGTETLGVLIMAKGLISFAAGGGVIDYPWLKRVLNSLVNFLIRVIFRVPLNDTTNAFKAYRRLVIEGCRPLIAPHFNLTVELPPKAIVRRYTWTVVLVT